LAYGGASPLNFTHLPSVERNPEFVQKASSANSAPERTRKDRTSGGQVGTTKD